MECTFQWYKAIYRCPIITFWCIAIAVRWKKCVLAKTATFQAIFGTFLATSRPIFGRFYLFSVDFPSGPLCGRPHGPLPLNGLQYEINLVILVMIYCVGSSVVPHPPPSTPVHIYGSKRPPAWTSYMGHGWLPTLQKYYPTTQPNWLNFYDG